MYGISTCYSDVTRQYGLVKLYVYTGGDAQLAIIFCTFTDGHHSSLSKDETNNTDEAAIKMKRKANDEGWCHSLHLLFLEMVHDFLFFFLQVE